MTKIISISNHKGGVGKTTSVVNIGHGLARKGKNVLLIDLDPQANLSQSLLKDYAQIIDLENFDIYKALTEKTPELEPLEIVCSYSEYELRGTPKHWPHPKTQGRVHLVPSSIDLSGAELELSGEAGREYILSELLQDLFKRTKKDGIRANLKDYAFTYDYVLIDTPPSIGLLTINSLTASHYVLIPVQAQYLALMGLSKLLEAIAKIKTRLNKKLKIGGVFLTQYTDRHRLDNMVKNHISNMRDYNVYKVFYTTISKSNKLATAPVYHQSIFEYDPNSTGSIDYANLVNEILKLK